jgi:hypothetical protein
MNGPVADCESAPSGAANAWVGSAEVTDTASVDVVSRAAGTPLAPFVDTLQVASANGRQPSRHDATADVYAAVRGVADGLTTATDIRVRWHNHE